MYIDEKKVTDFLKKKINAPNCPLCGSKDWNIMTRVFQAIEYNGGSSEKGNQAIPIMPLTCMNCGNTYFINALVAKFIEPTGQEKADVIEDKEK